MNLWTCGRCWHPEVVEDEAIDEWGCPRCGYGMTKSGPRVSKQARVHLLEQARMVAEEVETMRRVLAWRL